jgi:exodeoxyribonuclease VII large subunit
VEKYGRSILALVNGQVGDGEAGARISNDEFLISNKNTSVGEPINRHATNAEEVGEKEMRSSDKQKVTVSQYLEYLNVVFQRTAEVKVVGEVSGGKMYPSGFYFTLKDKADESALNCYLPTYTYRGLGIPIEDGMEVSIEGMPRMVKRNGRFQFAVENLELVGEGALKKAYDLLKVKLEEEGLFARKRELPEFVTSVGIITSRAGAVIHDFRNNLAKLGIKLYLKDVRVEGVSSVGMVVEAIKWFNAQDSTSPNLSYSRRGTGGRVVDVIIIMRGGGSLEDLQGFNNEAVVRAVFGSKIPTIIAIGHDKDVPLAQLAADVMVSTPTAAAHAVSATWSRLVEQLPRLESNLFYNYTDTLARVRSRFTLATSSLTAWCNRLSQSYKRIQESLVTHATRTIDWLQNQHRTVIGHIGRIGQIQANAQAGLASRLGLVVSFLDQANPERQLKLGYSIVKNKRGKVVRSVQDVRRSEIIETQVADGSIKSEVK